jgi:transposase
VKVRRGKTGPPGLKLTTKQYNEIVALRKVAKKAKDAVFDTRLRAVLLVGGERRSAREAAEMCELHPRVVEGFVALYRRGGAEGLRPGKAPGRVPRLSPEQKAALAPVIESGPLAAGYETGVWTASLVVDVIQKRFDIEYSQDQVRRILHQLGFSVQYPRKKLALVDHEAQAKWIRRTLPALKKRPRDRAPS